MRLKTISSLEKCFLTESVSQKTEYIKASCLRNEVFILKFVIRLLRKSEQDMPIFRLNPKLRNMFVFLELNRCQCN